MREVPFKVDVGGVLEVLGGSLYSRKDTAIRELIQNAHDAIVRRRATDLGFIGAIRLRQDATTGRLTVEDDGVGLTQEEAEAYLGTLGAGVSGLLKKERPGAQDASRVIGQFGVGLFSAFLIASRIVVDSRQAGQPAVRWEAGPTDGVRIGTSERTAPGTLVTLELRPDAREWAKDEAALSDAVRGYADFLPVPIHVNERRQRVNVMEPSWLEATPDPEVVTLELEQRFEETPLDVVLLRQESPVPIQGALYASPARTPGFSGRPLVTVTLRRMVISTRLDGLLPEWGSFYRGVLELPACRPVTSREDLVRDEAFARVQAQLERLLLERLRSLGRSDATKLRALIGWHRYTLAGAALDEPRLREVLAEHYLFQTTQGALPFVEVARRAASADPGASERVVWRNTDRRQEAWTTGAFAGHAAPCVQATRSFEGALLGALADDARARGEPLTVEAASPRSERFLRDVLGVREPQEVAGPWAEHLAVFEARVSVAAFAQDEPAVLAFLDDSAGLRRDVAALKEHGALPASFGRMIDEHLGERDAGRNQVLLNRRHALVRQALAGSVHSPLASVLRLLVANALTTAGAPPGPERDVVKRDLEWIAETVAAGKKP